MKFRKEYDSIGKINVPIDKYWGASTERSKKFFDIGEIFVQRIIPAKNSNSIFQAPALPKIRLYNTVYTDMCYRRCRCVASIKLLDAIGDTATETLYRYRDLI